MRKYLVILDNYWYNLLSKLFQEEILLNSFAYGTDSESFTKKDDNVAAPSKSTSHIPGIINYY